MLPRLINPMSPVSERATKASSTKPEIFFFDKLRLDWYKGFVAGSQDRVLRSKGQSSLKVIK